MINKRKITCVSISSLYEHMLREFGIHSGTIKENPEDDHVHNEIKLQNGKIIKVDIQMDMHNIQTKCRLQEFQIEEPELTQMLIELGYIKDEQEYRDERIEKVKKQVEGLSSIEALDIILKSKEIYEGMEGIGTVEADKYYKTVLKKIRKDELGDTINRFECYKENPETKKRSYTLCICSKDLKQDIIRTYLFSSKEGRYLECDIATIGELQEEGLILGKTGRERGIKDIQKAIKKEKEKQKTGKEEQEENQVR